MKLVMQLVHSEFFLSLPLSLSSIPFTLFLTLRMRFMGGKSYASIKQKMLPGWGMYSINTLFLPFDGYVCIVWLAGHSS